MKILFLTSRFPYPPYRGDKLKIFNLIRQLSQRHNVSLLSFVESDDELDMKGALTPFCRHIESVVLSKKRSYLNCAIGVGTSRPFQTLYFSSAAMTRAFQRMVDRVEPDIVHTHLIRMAQYTHRFAGVPRVLDLTDAVSLYLRRFRDSRRNVAQRWLLNLELKRMLRYEPIIQEFNRVLVCSDVDREVMLHTTPLASIDILLNGIDTDTFATDQSIHSEPGRIVFTGNMSYFPNIDAAEFLVREIMPLVHIRVPGAKLFLIGQNPPRRVQRLASKTVEVTGFVADLRTEYLKSMVAVSPIRFGAGTLNKVLEPLALGIPVVASPLSVEGLHLKPEEEFLLACTPSEFADQIVRVLIDREFRLSRGAEVMNLVRSRYSWKRVAETLESIYETVISESRHVKAN